MQCLSKTAIAVYDFISYLSWLDIDDTIRPSSNGLRSLYYFDNHSIGIIEDKCSNGKSFEQVIRVLTGLRTTENENLSAVARHGLCIYRPYLEDPNKGVEGHLRLRVVPGQIERNGRIYDQIDDADKGKNTRRHSWSLKNRLEEAITQTIAHVGTHPRLQIAVEETINASTLRTSFVIFRETIFFQTQRGSLHGPEWDYLIQAQGSYLSVPGLSCSLVRKSLELNRCQNSHSSTATNPPTNGASVKPWSGRCSFVDLPWWTKYTNAQLPSIILQSNHLALALCDADENMQLIVGPFPLLYCLVCVFGTRGRAFLVKPDDCLVCMDPCRTTKKLFIRYFEGGTPSNNERASIQKLKFISCVST